MNQYSSTVTTKGQITIPSYIRNKFSIQAGSKVEFIPHEDSFIVIPINKSVRALRNLLLKSLKKFDIEEINQIIKEIRK